MLRGSLRLFVLIEIVSTLVNPLFVHRVQPIVEPFPEFYILEFLRLQKFFDQMRNAGVHLRGATARVQYFQ
jgi:hypothetical protein